MEYQCTDVCGHKGYNQGHACCLKCDHQEECRKEGVVCYHYKTIKAREDDIEDCPECREVKE